MKKKTPTQNPRVSFSAAPDLGHFIAHFFAEMLLWRCFNVLSSGAGRGFTTQAAQLRHTAGVPPPSVMLEVMRSRKVGNCYCKFGGGALTGI